MKKRTYHADTEVHVLRFVVLKKGTQQVRSSGRQTLESSCLVETEQLTRQGKMPLSCFCF